MKIGLNGVPEVEDNLLSIRTTIRHLLHVILCVQKMATNEPPTFHLFFTPFQASSTHTHTCTLLYPSPKYGVALVDAFEPQTPLFLHHSSPAILSPLAERTSGCYHAPGNQRYSHMSQIGVNSYYSGEGVEGKWKLTYQKGHSSDSLPTPPSHFLHLPTICRCLSLSTSPLPVPSSAFHRPMIFDQ